MTDDTDTRSAAEAVAGEWRSLLAGSQDLVDAETVRAAHAQPLLRQLFPLVSHGVMYFSGCTGMPAAHVGGQVHPRGADGRFRVAGPKGVGTLGRAETLEEAFALVVANLPEGCGPAVLGGAGRV
ncbi:MULTISPECIES: DUF6193 family natural product biosynthesis protein [unclassified Streptomyces]|uniref:DUF6193 family natural product biosynthesis protein n=1 Tax=unclassified Streptomyces TaxID=2593676 RepID=UPI0006F4E249|nr:MULTISPECIES: DUF6193 family natural product biosynthesis protein [unclassified Streptomyces]KQX50769.1 hypothetical protein ASD33_12005 [Streptomyces sp. Root1304]KRA84934.1 hypothetical protein ASE09_12010 [Streptomyces sp. Root66D1]